MLPDHSEIETLDELIEFVEAQTSPSIVAKHTLSGTLEQYYSLLVSTAGWIAGAIPTFNQQEAEYYNEHPIELDTKAAKLVQMISSIVDTPTIQVENDFVAAVGLISKEEQQKLQYMKDWEILN